jgi:hypothetical protein
MKDPRPARWWFSAGLAAIVWLASCQWLGVGPNPEPALTPIVTLVPIPSATARETVNGPAGTLAIVPPESEEIGIYHRLEPRSFGYRPCNPFDPDELEIRVEFTAPSGKRSEIGAFWYREFRPPAAVLANGPPSWRARFTPTEVGSWTAVARIPARGLETEPVTFQVTTSANPGFIRVHPQNPRYVAFDDGTFFYPIGLNMGWWSGAGTALGDYNKWMTLFASNGGNTIRVWMVDWSFGIEWDDTHLGDYTRRLGKAWLLDQIFRMAEEAASTSTLSSERRRLQQLVHPRWRMNPTTRIGGRLTSGVTSLPIPDAALFQRRLNYIVNCWGYSPTSRRGVVERGQPVGDSGRDPDALDPGDDGLPSGAGP